MRGELSSHLQLEHVKQAVLGLETTMFPMTRGQKDFVGYTVRAASAVVDRMNALGKNEEQGRKGGVLLIMKEGEWPDGYVATQIIGKDEGGKPENAEEVEHSNPDKHVLYAIGKALVLVNNKDLLGSAQNKSLPEQNQQHITLRGKDVPGGAIRINGIIYSFSGYATAEEDECVILGMLEWRGLISRVEALEYASQLGNAKYAELADRLVCN